MAFGTEWMFSFYQTYIITYHPSSVIPTYATRIDDSVLFKNTEYGL